MKEHPFTTDFLNFLTLSSSPFHAVSNMAERFRTQGYHQLFEQDKWELETGNNYFVVRDDGALIAFHLRANPAENGFRIIGAHSDSPCLQIKPLPDIKALNYHQLGVEIYGGALLNPWFDRDLSVAGRACCKMKDGTLKVFLVDFHRPLLSIPSLAIHLDRDVNKNRSLNAQKHLTPILSQIVNDQLPSFDSVIAEQISQNHKEADGIEVLGYDMFCYDPQPPALIGLKNEFISAGRLDNLLSCFVGMISMLEAKGNENHMFICNNHEEIGSTSTTGAHGSLPTAILERIVPDPICKRICESKSFFISMDNAHAVHPNYQEKSDPSHQILLNHGPVIKINAGQRYASNSFTRAVFQMLAKEIGVDTQEFVMRSDMVCGSTIGPIISSRLGIQTVDVGAPTLAMHSIRELTGSRDPFLLYRTILHFLIRQELPHETCRC
jgi:aspartyl aminopeptidase